MDEDKECDVPASVFTSGVSTEAGGKCSNLFKEPAGMTTISLTDAPIPDERKISEKFTFVNGVRKYKRLLWMLMSIILVLLVFTIYENKGLNVFQNTEQSVLCQESNTSLLCNSIKDMKYYEYTTPSTELKENSFTTKITNDVVRTKSKESYTKLENKISGTLVINPNFFGVAASNSESSDQGPTYIIDVLSILGNALETNKLNRKKRSQQSDHVDAVIAEPPKLAEDCDGQTHKDISSESSNIVLQTENVLKIKEIKEAAEKQLKALQINKSNNKSKERVLEKQKIQGKGSSDKIDPEKNNTLSSNKNRNQNGNNDSVALEHTTPLNSQVDEREFPSREWMPIYHDKVNQSESNGIPVGALTREISGHKNNEQNNKQKDTKPLQATEFPIRKEHTNKDIDNIKIEHTILTSTTESSHKSATQHPSSLIQGIYVGVTKSENVRAPTSTPTDNNLRYEEKQEKAATKGVINNLKSKKNSVQNNTVLFSKNLNNKTELTIATPITEPSLLKQTQSILKQQEQVNRAKNVYSSASINQTINCTHTPQKQGNFDYFEKKEPNNDNTDFIEKPYMPVTSRVSTSTYQVALQPHVELGYTADPIYEEEKNSTDHSSSSVPSKSTGKVNLRIQDPISIINKSNSANVATKTTHSAVAFDGSTKNNEQFSTNSPLPTKPTSNFSAVTDGVTAPKNYTMHLLYKPEDKNINVSLASFSQFKGNNTVTTTPAYVQVSDVKKNSQSSELKHLLEDIVGMKKIINTENQRKGSIEASFTEQMQSSQMKENQYPCSLSPMGYGMPPSQYYYPPFPPYPYPIPGNDQLKIVNYPLPKQQAPILILNPPVMNYVPPYMMPSQNYPQVGSSYGDYNPVGPLQSVDPKGQYYMCNAIPAPLSHIVTVPAVEVRKVLSPGLISRERTITPSKSLICPTDHVSCFDNSRCIKQIHICDGEVDCKDGSDESDCTCNDRIQEFRRCDGYIDCPQGEDEVGCFECSKDEFSCNDWNSRYRRSTCIPLEQRCDGIEQCPVGFDEIDCSVLTDTLEENKLIKVSNAAGFLNRNYKGKWYPTCFGTEVWAAEVCKTESGPNPHHLIPERRLIKIQSDYSGPYIEETQTEGLHLKDKCAMEGTATFVRCPPLICGMRLKIHNPYRMQEVETSHEILEETPPDEQISDDVLGDSRIVGGDGSQPASWPWVVTIYRNGIFHCSGVIINELWIASAAHCVDKFWMYYYEIQAGVLRRFSYAPQTQIRWITHAISYSNYNKSTLQHDIALLKLSAPLRYNRYVRPICLPSESTAGINYFNAPYPGTECTVVGWGATSEHSADPDHLREVRVPVLPVCKYEEDREANAICAGFSDGGRDACQGDSGGPFMCINPNHPHQWYLAGVVSHGEGCARPDEPGIYTRVSLYVEWIMEYVNSQQPLPPQKPLQKCPGYICRGNNRCISKKRHCDRIVDCLHGDDELNCHSWKLDEYLKNVDYAFGRDSLTSLYDSEEDDTARDIIVSEPLKSNFQLPLEEFTCKKLHQRIPQNKRCNKVVDCEDGTDEMGCKCRDYLLTTDSSAICDGITDCADLSDEAYCGTCKSTEFHCRLSRRCIPLDKRCNDRPDCPNAEDEWDCLALTNGTTIILDADGRPELRSSGIVAVYDSGRWKAICTSDQKIEGQAPIAAYLCSSLGFNDYSIYKIFPKSKLQSRILKPFVNHSTLVQVYVQQECAMFYVKCSSETTHPMSEKLANTGDRTEEQLYNPWIARIYVNGIYQCAGVLIDSSWVLTSTKCFEQPLETRSYLTVLLGTGKGNPVVQGLYEQIVTISNHYRISDSSAVLLKLQHPVRHTRHVRPIVLNTRININHERCMASNVDEHGSVKTVKLISVPKKCKKGFKCFKRRDPTNEKCESQPWFGVIVCESGRGWYPSAFFSDTMGYCGFNSVSKYPAVNTLINKFKVIMSNAANASKAPLLKCNGFRCKLGQCIDNAKTCDGVPDCRSAEDEDETYCTKLKQTCQISRNCTCFKWQMRCANGNCVQKKSFCDNIDDCGDGSDEPDRCTCRSYLKVSDPTKICDGIIHCRDSSDERSCICDGSNFKCERSFACVANATVCDGVYDCPNGEDEDNCLALKPFDGTLTSGEVIARTAGVWHSGCFPHRMDQKRINTICNLLNLKGKHSMQLRTDKPEVTRRATIDRFSLVQLSRSKTSVFWLRLRSGFDPYVTFNNTEKPCYKLFVDCR